MGESPDSIRGPCRAINPRPGHRKSSAPLEEGWGGVIGTGKWLVARGPWDYRDTLLRAPPNVAYPHPTPHLLHPIHHLPRNTYYAPRTASLPTSHNLFTA